MSRRVIPLRSRFRLAALRCELCGGEVTIVGIPLDETTPLRCWCAVPCAERAGWPFLSPRVEARESR